MVTLHEVRTALVVSNVLSVFLGWLLHSICTRRSYPAPAQLARVEGPGPSTGSERKERDRPMKLRIYVIVEEGADRKYVQTVYPAWYVPPKDRRAEIFAVDVELPEFAPVDRTLEGRGSPVRATIPHWAGLGIGGKGGAGA